MKTSRSSWLFITLVLTSAAFLANASFAQPGDTTQTAGTKSIQAEGNQVSITNFKFRPAVLAVPVGTTVTWINHDAEPHTITSTEQRFESAALDTDDHFSHKFTALGTYAYFCTVHPFMTGAIKVTVAGHDRK